MRVHLLKSMASGHLKIKKGTGHVLILAIPCNTVVCPIASELKRVRPIASAHTSSLSTTTNHKVKMKPSQLSHKLTH